jgi:hypothetical protein
MSIRKKDGTIYKLSGPNPIMKNQQIWDGKYKLHNFEEENQKEIIAIPKPIKPPEEPKKIENLPKKNDFIQELQESKPKEVKKIPVIADLTKIACLPSYFKEKENFYGEKKKQFFYGNPFVFEGEVLDQQDIFIKIKTKTEIPYNSIIFPKDEFMRWWKVQSYNKESNILLAYPSEEQPSFEELF